MTTTARVLYAEAETLPQEGLEELVVYAIRLLAARGAATADDYRLLEQLEKRPQMDTAIQMFKFENKQEIRVIEGSDGEPWFIASDLCQSLGLGNVSQALSRLDNDEIDDIISNDVAGRANHCKIVNEPGMYGLILASKKPDAKRFKRWIKHEVLPVLRKHGTYSVKTMTTGEQLVAQAQAMLEYERRLTVVEDFVHAQQTEQKRLPARAGVNSTEYYSIAAYAHIQGIQISNDTANEYGRRAARWSKDNGYSIGQAPDPRWGRVNTYHIDALEHVFGSESN